MDASGAPGLGLPSGDLTVFLRRHADLGEKRGAGAGDQHFGVALEHQLYGLAARVLGEPRPFQAPDIDLKLAAKSGANVLADHVNIALRDAQRLGKLVAQNRNALR